MTKTKRTIKSIASKYLQVKFRNKFTAIHGYLSSLEKKYPQVFKAEWETVERMRRILRNLEDEITDFIKFVEKEKNGKGTGDNREDGFQSHPPNSLPRGVYVRVRCSECISEIEDNAVWKVLEAIQIFGWEYKEGEGWLCGKCKEKQRIGETVEEDKPF